VKLFRILFPLSLLIPFGSFIVVLMNAARGVRHGLLTLFLLEVKKRKEESREGVWREEMPRSDSSRIGSVWNFGERPED